VVKLRYLCPPAPMNAIPATTRRPSGTNCRAEGIDVVQERVWVRPQRSHIAQDEKAAIESIQTSATAGPITGSVASKKQPTFEQLLLANILLLQWQKDLAGSSRFILTSQAVAGRHRRGPLNPSDQPSVTLPGAIFLPLARGPGTAGDAATVEVPWSTRCDTLGQVLPPESFGPCALVGEAAMVEVPWSTRCDMPGQVFPPESFGPSAIAGERLTVKTKATIAARHHEACISDLRSMNVGVGSSRSARLRRSGDRR
jgi:hypothetical protein